jgi:hypothetical protein
VKPLALQRLPGLRLFIIAVATMALAAGVWYAIRHPLYAGAVPAAVAVWVLIVVHHLYLAVRHYQWKRRRRREAKHATPVPADVTEPEDFPGVGAIDAAQHRMLPAIPDFQGAVYARGLKVALLPPLAVLIAAVQSVVNVSAPIAAGLAFAQFVVMMFLILLVWLSRNPSDAWVQQRTQAELLRREKYLRMAGVGPYQGQSLDLADHIAETRIDTLTSATGSRLVELLPMRPPNAHMRWIDQLYTQPPTVLDALLERVRTYEYCRIDRQTTWFNRSAEINRAAERRISTFVKVALLVTVVVIVVQGTLHLTHADQRTLSIGTALATLLLPPLCAFLLAFQELFSHRRLATSYEQMLNVLADERARVADLLHRMRSAEPGADNAFNQEFQAAVLHTESAITNELQRWIMLTQRDEYDVSL